MTHTQCIRSAGVYHPDRAETDGTVLVFDDDVITELRDSVPGDAEVVVDRPDEYVLPGFVDTHSHASIRPWEGDQIGQLQADPARQAVRATSNLARDLTAGVTTMRLMAAERHIDVTLADLEADGELHAPRLLPSGIHLTPTGGHGLARTATDGPDEIRDRIRENAAAGAHHVKYFATGGVSSETGGLDRVLYSDHEVEAIVAEARRQSMHVATHAHGGGGAHQAVAAGVDTIEHAGALDERTIDALDGSSQFVVGTFSLLFDDDGITAGDADSEDVLAKVRAARDTTRSTWERLLQRDVNVALGTDSMHGNISAEARYLREFGASPERAVRAITTDAARAARVADTVGRLTPGYAMDAVFVPNHPLDDPSALETPTEVVKRGDLV